MPVPVRSPFGVPCDEIFDRISERFIEIRDNLGLSYRIESDLEEIRSKLGRDMSIDELVSRGEYLTARLMAEFLGYYFLDASKCIFMDYDGSFLTSKISQAIKDEMQKHEGIVSIAEIKKIRYLVVIFIAFSGSGNYYKTP